MRGRLAFLVIIHATQLFAFQPDNAAIRKLFEDALSRRIREFGEADSRTAQAARDLGLFLCRSGDTASAKRGMANAIRIDEKALGPNHPDVATLLDNLAELYKAQGRNAAAEPLFKRSMAIREKAGVSDRDRAE